MADPIDRLSLEHRTFTVAADHELAVETPVELAFMSPGQRPGDDDWHTAEVLSVTQVGSTWRAACRTLIGPDGDVTLTPGGYVVWLRVTDISEIPVVAFDKIRVS